jgi:hypothetical protein
MSMQGGKQNAGGIAGFVDDLNGAIRENPVAAGLVGMGVLWMFIGGDRFSAFGKSLPGAAGAVSGAVGSAGSAVGQAMTSGASYVANAARQAGQTMSAGAGDVSSKVREAASSAYDTLSSSADSAVDEVGRRVNEAGRMSVPGQDFRMKVQQNLSETLERQPLLLGVIGVAIGAGIASAFPATKIEQEMMGEAGSAVKDRIQELASEASQRAKDVLGDVKSEVEKQGLMPQAIAEDLKGIADKARVAAGASRDSIKDRLS